MLLIESVCFKAVLRSGSRVQIPRLFRWQYKMEPDQMLRVDVRVEGCFDGEWFLARMTKDGRLTIPKLALQLLQEVKKEAWKAPSLRSPLSRHEQEKPELNL